MATDITPGEQMVAAAAREIADGEVVFVGMRLPLLAFCVAKGTHAPSAYGLFESGVIRDQAAPVMPYTMCDPPNIAGATACTPMSTVMSVLQRGEVDLGFIGGAETDRFGNLNTSYIGDPHHPTIKLPGSGGAADIACLARRLVVIMPHERRRFRERVDYVTSPGFGEGAGWREREGVVGGGPSALITTLGVFGFDPDTRQAVLRSVHPHTTLDVVRAETGAMVEIPDGVPITVAPTADELAIIRQYDPTGFWTGA